MYTSKMVTKQYVATVVASPFSLWPATCWKNQCSPVFSITLLIFSYPNLNAGSCTDAAQLTCYLLPGNCWKNVVNSIKTYAWPSLIRKRHLMLSIETFFENSAQIWLPSHFYCHTTTIPYWYACSSCHGWFSVLQLSRWIGSETRLCSSPNHLQPVHSRNNTCISPGHSIIWLRWNRVSSWWCSLILVTSPGLNQDIFCSDFCQSVRRWYSLS